MRYIKFIAVFFVSIFLISTVLPHAAAQSDDRRSIIDRIIIGFYKWTFKTHFTIGGKSKKNIRGHLFDPLRNTPWKVGFRGALPEQFHINPDTVDIRYLNQTEITIGIKDEKGEWTTGDITRYVIAIDYEFSLDFPDSVPENAFKYNFVPPFISGKDPVVTKLTITPNMPMEAYPGDINITLVAKKWVSYSNFFSREVIGPSAIRFEWALRLAGKREEEPPAKANIIIKIDRFHLAEIVPTKEAIETESDDIVSIPIEIRNHGSHIDTFNFRASTNPDNGLIISPPPALTLKPHEIARTSFSVATPRNFQDPGTVHSIEIEAYSVYEPELTFKNTVTIITRGVYVSDVFAIYSSFFGLMIVLGVAFMFWRRRRILSKFCKKPERPWNIPDEKENLEKLKEKDKEEYKKVFKMMEEEYASSLLWYKYYAKAIKAKKIPKIIIMQLIKKYLSIFISQIKRFLSIFKLPMKKEIKKPVKKKLLFKEKKVKVEKVKPVEVRKKKNLRELTKNFLSLFKLLKKKVKKVKEVEKIKPLEVKKEEKREIPVVDRKAEMEKRRKEQIILKIKREQEKQRRKLKSSIP